MRDDSVEEEEAVAVEDAVAVEEAVDSAVDLDTKNSPVTSVDKETIVEGMRMYAFS